MLKTLVIVPTYNEKENVPKLVPAILSKCPDVEILFVDDNSPDGTQDEINKLITNGYPVYLLPRAGKQGLGKAYLAGFAWALAKDYELIVEMDADFSHRPEDLGKIVPTVKPGEFVIGSRYIPGGGTQNWEWWRKVISVGGSIYTRMILWRNLRDWTGGFNFWSRQVLEGIDLEKVFSDGYSFQIELKYRALKKGFPAREFPILFDERRQGTSKMSLGIVLEAFYRVWQLRAKV